MSGNNGDHRWEFTRQTVNAAFDSAGPRKLSAINRIKAAIVKEENKLIAERPTVFLGMPTHNLMGVHLYAQESVATWATNGEDMNMLRATYSNSLLTRGFNHLWLGAIGQMLQGTVTHFAMLHSDVVPEKNWLDALLAEYIRSGADILSVVIPIKNHCGLTSTAMTIPGDKWMYRRLVMKEIMQLPETFGTLDVTRAGFNQHGGDLLVNTGCWICDLRKPWVRAEDNDGNLRCHFHIADRVRIISKELNEVGIIPEDWNFCRMLLGVNPDAKIMATRKIKLEHKGEFGYSNEHAWGEYEHDTETLNFLASKAPVPEEPEPEHAEAVPMT